MHEIALLTCTNYLNRLQTYLKSIEDTVEDYNSIEVLVKIDKENQELVNYFFSEQHKKYPFRIKYLVGERQDGYFSLGEYYNRLVLMTDYEDGYFIFISSDKIKFSYKGWDKVILSYKDKFYDNIFILKCSPMRRETVYIYENKPIDLEKFTHFDMSTIVRMPDNHSFFTRKLYSLMGGIGEVWAPDSWFEPLVQILKKHYNKDRIIIIKEDLIDPKSIWFSNKSPEGAALIDNIHKKLMDINTIKYIYIPIVHQLNDEIDRNHS